MSVAPPEVLDTASLREWAIELGIDELGVCHAKPYAEAEAVIRERVGRGLFADMQFTMTRTEVSCHPEKLVDGAQSVISTALCYWQPDVPDAPDAGPLGRIARYTRNDAYAALTARLEVIATWLREQGYAARIFVDSNENVDREAARLSGVGFPGKNTLIITRKHGSWVVLGTLVTDATLEPTPPMREGCGSCTACIDACPTDAIIDGGRTLDATKCVTYWTQSRKSVPLDIREGMQDMVAGCDICQDACPWNRGVEKRRAGEDPYATSVDLVEWLTAPDAELNEAWKRLYVPRRKMNYLRRNALIALGNTGTEQDAALAAPYLADADPMLREHAAWALRMIGGPIAAAALWQAQA